MKNILTFFLLLLFLENLSANDFLNTNEKKPATEEINNYLLKPCSAIISLKHIESGGVGYDDGYTTIETQLFPIKNSRKVCSFIDLRYHVLNDSTQAFNLGVGCRYSPAFLKYAFGLNIYYDFREKKHNFHQIGAGLEFLGEKWDLRLNGYLPITDEKLLLTCHFDNYIGDYHITRKKLEAALTGVDLEIGKLLNHPNSNVNIYSAVGTYYYGGDNVCRRSFGGRVRLNTNIYKFLLFETILTFDSIFKTKFQGLIKISIPFGCNTKKKYRDIFSKHVNRQEIVVLDEFCKWKWNY